VQGVGFRWATWETASRLGLAGWVRNRSDGSVECWAEGEEDVVGALVAWLHEGPVGSGVGEVAVEEAPPGGLEGFEIRA
jgi:acylphosphatase